MSTRIFQSTNVDIFKRGLSDSDVSDKRLELTLATSGNVWDLGDRFRANNGTANSQTMSVGGASTTLKTLAAGVAGSRNLCAIGDSRTAPTTGDTYVKLLKDRFGGDLTLLGSNGSGSNINEGHSGKDFDWLANHADSPLTSATDTLDIASWITTIGATPDLVTYWSDVNAYVNTVVTGSTAEVDWPTLWTAEFGHLQDIIDGIDAENASAKHVIIMSPVYNLTDSDWSGYNAAYTAGSRETYRQFTFDLNAAYVSTFGGREVSDRIWLFPAHLFVGGDHDFPAGDPFHPMAGTVSGLPRGHAHIEQQLAALLTDIW